MTDPTTTAPLDLDALRKIAETATKGPWAYRPLKYDDWGIVRGSEVDGIQPVVAHCHGDGDHAKCRASGKDPYGPNAAHIVAFDPPAHTPRIRQRHEARV